MNGDKPADYQWMAQCLSLAKQAAEQGEVPVGALVVAHDGQLLSKAHNQPIGAHDPTGHAEVVALRQAARARNNYRLPGCTLYVSLEPCTMCVGAMLHARIARLVFAALEPKAGAVMSKLRLLDSPFYNHRIEYEQGPLGEEAGLLLRHFFQNRRK